MIQFTRIALLLGMAGSLVAQTLSFGEITAVTPATTPPSYVVNLNLKTAGTASAGLVAGFQFDVNYDPTQLKVTVGLGANTSAFQINTTCLGSSFTGCTSAATFNPSTTAGMNNGPGQRAIVVGCCSSAQVGGTSQVTSALIVDGPVATLTVQPLNPATTTGQTLTLLNPAATSQGGNNVAAASIPLTIGIAGSIDPGRGSVLNLYPTYMVGDIFPLASNAAPAFGDKSYDVRDLVQELLAVTGLSVPACGTDRFDAMDIFPTDSTTRGGDGKLDVRDLTAELLLETGLNPVRPVRDSLNGTCITAPFTAGDSFHPITQARVRQQPPREGTLSFGTPESLGSNQVRVPVYLQGGRDLARAVLAIGVGDRQSQLQFQPAPGIAPSVQEDGQVGAVAAAWLKGLDVRAGQQLLLGYVVGPAGFAPNLKVFGLSASSLDDYREIGLDVSGAVVVQQ